MATFIETLLWINLFAILAYVPVVCYLDIKYREVDPLLWIPLVSICAPIAAYMYSTGYWYPIESLAVSVVMIIIFRVAMQAGYLEGADFLFLTFISLFWVMTPINGAHGLMQFTFYIYLATVSMITAMFLYLRNISQGAEGTMIELASRYPNGVPYMVPISIAFILSVMMG